MNVRTRDPVSVYCFDLVSSCFDAGLGVGGLLRRKRSVTAPSGPSSGVQQTLRKEKGNITAYFLFDFFVHPQRAGESVTMTVVTV